MNGEPCMVLRLGGEIAGAVFVRLRQKKLYRMYAVVNPDKIARMQVEASKFSRNRRIC